MPKSNKVTSRKLSGGKDQPSYRTMAPKKWSQTRSSVLTVNKRTRKPK